MDKMKKATAAALQSLRAGCIDTGLLVCNIKMFYGLTYDEAVICVQIACNQYNAEV